MLPSIDEAMLPTFDGTSPISSASIDSRFFLYIYARQQGKWLDLLSADDETVSLFSVPEEELSTLPPAFLTASTSDCDVPFSFSKKLSLKIPSSRFLPVFDLEHDYDRNPDLPESHELYHAFLDWLDERVCSE